MQLPHLVLMTHMCGGLHAAAPGSHCEHPLWPAPGIRAVSTEQACLPLHTQLLITCVCQNAVRRSGAKPVSAKVDSWRATPRSSAPARRGSGGVEAVPPPSSGRPRYDGPDQELAAALERDLVDASPGVQWDDIAGG